MMNAPDWQWNEVQQVGTDYADVAEMGATYDKRMAEFRDVDAENREMLAMLELPAGASVLEIGCGTGRFSRAAGHAGLAATAIDVSPASVEYVRRTAQEEGVPDLTTRQAGFLTMDFPPASFDAAVSGAALHHLPDAWKYVGLHNIARVLKPCGQFILRDVVFTVAEGERPEDSFLRFVESVPTMQTEAMRHVAREFSTYDWIMDEMLARAGFVILSKSPASECFLVYHCRKP
jgi:putative AdoMet-dependent methyltransferase